ncbi:MAG TPA: BON domain-containing protein [Gemmataceae bacterium]
MTVPIRFSLALTLGLSLLQPAPGRAAEPSSRGSAPLSLGPASNQQTAENIAARLRQSGLLRHYDVDISFRDGVAELTGSVADAAQRDRVMQLVRDVSGVERVVDRLSVAGAIVPVQAGGAPGAFQPIPSSPAAPPANPAPQGNAAPPPAASGAPPAAGGAPPEAMPIFQAPGPAPHHLNQPRMPPYAWPTYAPYNNYSRVGYPLAYPYNSFPFIGPVYPFPKIPLGWRSVMLEWDDGFWWFSKTASKWDWWKLRYY